MQNVNIDKITIIGKVDNPEFEIYDNGKGYRNYTCEVTVPRLSGEVDVLRVRMNRTDKAELEGYTGWIKVEGAVRGQNVRNHLNVFVYAHTITKVDAPAEGERTNDVVIVGRLGRKPVYRKTKGQGKLITELTLSVAPQSQNIKNEIIPSIAWNKNATAASTLDEGQLVRVFGRLQSREYKKNIDGVIESRMTYEVSIDRLDYTEGRLRDMFEETEEVETEMTEEKVEQTAEE